MSDARDAALGREMASHREAKGLSREALADLMHEHGYDWTRATVWSVENGRRSLKFDEGRTLERLLGAEFSTVDDSDTLAKVRDALNANAKALEQQTTILRATLARIAGTGRAAYQAISELSPTPRTGLILNGISVDEGQAFTDAMNTAVTTMQAAEKLLREMPPELLTDAATGQTSNLYTDFFDTCERWHKTHGNGHFSVNSINTEP